MCWLVAVNLLLHSHDLCGYRETIGDIEGVPQDRDGEADSVHLGVQSPVQCADGVCRFAEAESLDRVSQQPDIRLVEAYRVETLPQETAVGLDVECPHERDVGV